MEINSVNCVVLLGAFGLIIFFYLIFIFIYCVMGKKSPSAKLTVRQAPPMIFFNCIIVISFIRSSL